MTDKTENIEDIKGLTQIDNILQINDILKLDETANVYIVLDTNQYNEGSKVAKVVKPGTDTWVKGTIKTMTLNNISLYDITIGTNNYTLNNQGMKKILEERITYYNPSKKGGKHTTRRGKKASHRKQRTLCKQRKQRTLRKQRKQRK